MKCTPHWNVSGEVDATQPREVAVLLLPAITLMLWAFMTAAPYLSYGHFKGFKDNYNLFVNVLVAFFAGFHIIILIATINGITIVVPRVMVVGLGFTFVIMGLMLGKATRNGFVGIRNAWTLTNDIVWEKTHRVGGQMFMGMGVFMMFVGAFMPIEAMAIVIVTTVLGMVIVLNALSYYFFRSLKADV